VVHYHFSRRNIELTFAHGAYHSKANEDRSDKYVTFGIFLMSYGDNIDLRYLLTILALNYIYFLASGKV